MKTESSNEQLLKDFWELRRKYGEYGTYIHTHTSISDSQLHIFSQMLGVFASEMNELESKLKKEGLL